MRKLIQLTIGGLVFVTVPLAAEEVLAPTAPVVYANAAILATMNDNIADMRRQIERISETTDPAERQRLIKDHMRLMTWQMEMAKHVTAVEWQSPEPAQTSRAVRALPTTFPVMSLATDVDGDFKFGSSLSLNGSTMSDKTVELEN